MCVLNRPLSFKFICFEFTIRRAPKLYTDRHEMKHCIRTNVYNSLQRRIRHHWGLVLSHHVRRCFEHDIPMFWVIRMQKVPIVRELSLSNIFSCRLRSVAAH
jgi:hypothetical protein